LCIGVQSFDIGRVVLYYIIACLIVKSDGMPMLDDEDNSHGVVTGINLYLKRLKIEIAVEVPRQGKYRSIASLY